MNHTNGVLTIGKTDGSSNVEKASNAFHFYTDSSTKTLKVNGIEFNLVDVDGGEDNGYELVYKNWTSVKKTKINETDYDHDFVYVENDGEARFTLTGAKDVASDANKNFSDK